MAIRVIILGFICAVAFARPIWGVAILLILTSSLFHLHQYATLSLPVGYIEPAEAILFYILLRIFWDRRQRGLQQFRNDESSTRERFAKKVLISAILPYAIWQTACCARGILIWHGTEHSRFAIRFLLNGVLPWSIIAIVWEMRHQAKDLLRMVLILSFITVLIHLLIQIFDVRSLMKPAYWVYYDEYDVVARAREDWLNNAEFVRGLPQGIMLITYSSIYVYSRLVAGSVRHSKTLLGLSTVCAFGLIITFTRSLAAQVIVGFGYSTCFAFHLHTTSPTVTMNRSLSVGMIFLLLLFGYMLARPAAWDFWGERIGTLDSTDYKIFSQENEARGVNNVAALNAICDRPIFGQGTPRYPDKYLLGDVVRDIHPMLQVGLVGGIPAIFLFLRLQWVIFWRFWRAAINDKERQRQLLGYFAIVALTGTVINVIGAGGTVSGNGLIAMTVIVGLMAAEFANPVANETTSSRKHSERRFFT